MLGSGPAAAQAPAQGAYSGNAVKIGILNDQSGLYAEFGGTGSVEAAKMAVEDMGGKVGGVPIEIVSADHQNKPDIARHRAPMVRPRRRRRDHGTHDLLGGARGAGLSKEKKKITITTGAASSDLTGKACTPYGYHWAYDTHALAVGTGGALTRAGGKTWFFLTADYAFGTALENDTSAVVKANGGSVVGSVRHPLSGQDFSSFLLQAQGSKAQVIGLANAGLDTSNSIKQGRNTASPMAARSSRRCSSPCPRSTGSASRRPRA